MKTFGKFLTEVKDQGATFTFVDSTHPQQDTKNL